MKNFTCFGKKLWHFCSSSKKSLNAFLHLLIFQANPFWVQLFYFVSISLMGFLALSVSKPRTAPSFFPHKLDLFFTSVSATTVSSMSVVEMEVFSNSQLIILTILMLLGGEVFVSMLKIQMERSKFFKLKRVGTHSSNNSSSNSIVSQIELNGISLSQQENEKNTNQLDVENGNKSILESNSDQYFLKYNSIRLLGHVVLGYLLVLHMGGSALVSSYISLVHSARNVLESKAIKILTFSAFTIVSTFGNCGYLPTNENMIVFKENTGLQLILIPQILLGNTLYPAGLRFSIWILGKITKRREFDYILTNYKEMGYDHLLSGLRSALLMATVFGFILVQLLLFCIMEWNLEGLEGLSSYQKFVASLFIVVNSRHAGESVVDLSTISSAILVIFVVMMYLPPYTSFLPIKKDHDQKILENGEPKPTGKRKTLLECLILSPLSSLAIFIILICITEREKLKNDPLNFNVLNITIEVISAYGNVGFSTGYSCKRQITPESNCKDVWYGFSGKWSPQGKLFLIIVMFYGRFKIFSLKGGKAWKLS
ncbi:hypothetical protein UlMin_005038 [Ulmus minor]